MRTKPEARLVVLLLALCGAQGLLAPAKQLAQAKAKPKDEAYAIVAGTVFRDPGFAQPGASVVLALKSAPGKKLQEQTSSPRGEFAFRVPPVPQTFLITATLKGFQTAQQEIEIQGQEQINATLLLVPESKKTR